ncbi:hypothetical protein VPH35_081649 [Triticum aestivum]
MEVCRDVASALAKLHQVISDDKKLETKMRTGLGGILLDMVHLNAYIEENSKGREQGPAHEAWILQLQDLAYDIEDFVDSLYRKPKEKFPLRAVRMITATDPRPEYGDEFTAFQERTARLEANKPSFPACTGQSGAAAQAASVLTAGPSMSPNGGTHTPSTSRLLSSDHGASPLVGIDRFKQDLVDLLKQVEGEPRELRVISILGVRGVGKTALARAIYQACGTFGDQEPFDCHAMVMVRPDDNEASGSNGAAELLREILIQVGNVAGQISNTSAAELENILRKDLEHKRYFIVIDGLQQEEDWDFLRNVFPQNEKSSRIVVSTSVQRVAKYCSSSTSFVYKMEGLDNEETKKLFWQEVGVPNAADSLKQLAQGICNGCHGLPLAVVSAAKYLRPIWTELKQSDWDREALALGQGEQPAFAELKKILVECFDGLTCHRVKTCLLSVTMFPKGHPIKRKSLFRRWIAEGFVEHDGRLDKNAACHELFRELIERHLVEPVESSRENLVPAAEVKMCQVHGVLLDFLLSESLRRNFTDLIRNNVPVQAARGGIRTRRLAVHTDDDCRVGAPCDVDLKRYSFIRSLTIVNSAFKDLLESEFLRVLDLEGSKGIDEQALCKIFQLIHLKYLSIRATDCCRIPKRIRRLHQLETLDARDSNVRELPIEVLLLPRLAHLFGEFQLPSELCSKKKIPITGKDVERVFKSSNSKLESVAGFLVDDRQGFQHIMLHMHNLKKVKMRWGSTSTAPTQDLSGLLADSLRRRFGLECLSIDFGEHSLDFMNPLSYSETCLLKSVKLRGSLSEGLPGFMCKLEYLSELHLFSTGLDSEALSALEQLSHLEHLQLEEVSDRFGSCTFSLAAGKFERLKRLIIDAPKLPQVTVANGAMAVLTTLELLCHDVTGFAATGISRLGSLSEVVLLKSLKSCDPGTWSRWEAEAKKHKKRPRISFCDSSNRQQRQAAAVRQQKSGSKWRMLPR